MGPLTGSRTDTLERKHGAERTPPVGALAFLHPWIKDVLRVTAVALMHEHSWPTTRRGGERYLHDIAWYLHRYTAMEPHVVTAWARRSSDEVEGVAVHRTWIASAPLTRVARRLPTVTSTFAASTGRRALAAIRPTAAHALSPAAALAGHAAGLPTVFTTLGAPDGHFARDHPRRWAVVARAAAVAEAVTAVGQSAARAFADALGRDVLALQPGIRLEAFPADLKARTGPPRILYASTITPRYKGFHAVLEAFPAIVDAHPDARLVVLGSGDVTGFLDRASPAVHRVRHHIEHHLPNPNEMPDWYASGTVTVLASKGEAFGLVLAESLACGTPIVASTDGGPAEILADGAGLVGQPTPPHDTDAIAEALLAAIELAAKPDTPAACRAHAARWDWVETIGPLHAHLYRSLLSG